jgi:hypothetical protein
MRVDRFHRRASIRGRVRRPEGTSHIAAGQVKVGIYVQRGADDLRGRGSMKCRTTFGETSRAVLGRWPESQQCPECAPVYDALAAVALRSEAQ